VHESEDVNPPVYRTGCAGRIVRFEESADGRFLITLHGVCRFDVAEEQPLCRDYRPVTPDWSPYRADMEAQSGPCLDRTRLLSVLRGYFDAQSIAADWDAIEASPDERLITCLSMICPFAAPEKQALLEAPTLTARGEVLTALVEMNAHGPAAEESRQQ
jgi:Lon protease-like protein